MNGPVEIVPGVHGLGSELVNWFVVEQDGKLTAVDAGLPGFRRDLEHDLRTAGFSLADVVAVVLTHSDADHTGVAPELREAGARVLIHAGDEGTLAKPGPKQGDASPRHLLPYLWRPAVWRLFGHMTRRGGARPPSIEGAETYADGELIDVPGRPRAVHTPGHTPGHCVLAFEQHEALFAGDALCTWNPLTGRRGPQLMPSALNVSNEQCLSSLDRIEPLAAKVVLPGHGDPWHGSPAEAVAAARSAGRS